MTYLIGQLALWLFLTAAFAALAGWAFAAQRAAPAEGALRRERESLLNDIIRLAGGERNDTEAVGTERETDGVRRLLEIRDGRIAELENSLEQARSRADEAASRLSSAQRGAERDTAGSEELTRLRGLLAAREAEDARTIDVEAQAADEENGALQAWRLRYFEQRVRYLEGLGAAARALGGATQPEPGAAPSLEWRAREAEARAAHLEQELRAREARGAALPLVEDAAGSPFAADADVDALLRWRLLYLERRVAYLQGEAAPAHAPAPVEALVSDAAPDPDRWKWRARYLESRVRHLEQRAPTFAPTQRVVGAAEPEIERRASATPPAPRAKPPVLSSARNGAPDDLTLIEGVSLLQQTTLYSIGVFHFDQIAAWTPEHVAWVDQYLRLRGRIDDEEWLEQADELAREGPVARRTLEDEDA